MTKRTEHYGDFNSFSEPCYGDFDGIPSRYNKNEAWVFHRNKNAWVEINRISHGNAVYEVSKQDFNHLHRRLPPLPPEAFTGE